MATSFISEHTAEFVLVPMMKSLLEKHYPTVLPIYPWLSREFSNRAKGTHGFSGFHILALFPRRPKLSNSDNVYVTINSELSAYKEIALKYGITVIAGCPLATNLWELASCNECAWLDVEVTNDYLEEVTSLNNRRITDREILRDVSQSEIHSMESLEEFIRNTRYTLPAGFFGTRYKPVYFLISELR